MFQKYLVCLNVCQNTCNKARKDSSNRKGEIWAVFFYGEYEDNQPLNHFTGGMFILQHRAGMFSLSLDLS